MVFMDGPETPVLIEIWLLTVASLHARTIFCERALMSASLKKSGKTVPASTAQSQMGDVTSALCNVCYYVVTLEMIL